MRPSLRGAGPHVERASSARLGAFDRQEDPDSFRVRSCADCEHPLVISERLASWFEAKNVGADCRLIGEGASGYDFFVLADGSAAVTVNGAEVGALGRGDFFGEIAILGDGRRSATVTTTAPSRLLVMFGTEFRRLQQEYPEIVSQIEATMSERVAHALTD